MDLSHAVHRVAAYDGLSAVLVWILLSCFRLDDGGWESLREILCLHTARRAAERYVALRRRTRVEAGEVFIGVATLHHIRKSKIAAVAGTARTFLRTTYSNLFGLCGSGRGLRARIRRPGQASKLSHDDPRGRL